MRPGQLRRILIAIALILVALWLVSLIWNLIAKAEVAITQAREARMQYAALEERRNALQASLGALETPRGKDAAIRGAFGVARPGEEVIVVVPPAPKAATEPESWVERVFGWF